MVLDFEVVDTPLYIYLGFLQEPVMALSYVNVIYLELAIEADGGVRKLFSGKKGRTSVP